jgi:hypothetical protein
MAQRHFSAAGFRTLGSAAVAQNLFTIQNTGANVVVRVKRLVFQMDATVVLTTFMPIIKTSRSAAASGGTVLTKVRFDTTETDSHADVVVRGANASDGGGATAITCTPGASMWQQYGMRMHSLVGQVLGLDNNSLSSIVADYPVVLRSGEVLVVHVVAAATSSNPNTNHYFVECIWSEDES